MLEDQIEDALAGADHRDCHAGQRNMVRTLAINGHPGAVGHPDLAEGHVGDMQDRVEYRNTPGRHLVRRDDEHSGTGHHRQPVGAITVEDMACRTVQHPAISVPVRRHPVVHGGTRLVRVEPIHRQGRELTHRREERAGIGGTTQLFEHDRQLDRADRIVQLGPAKVHVDLP